jgi:hypothetical protein
MKDYLISELESIVLKSYRNVFSSDIFFIRALDKLEKNLPKKDFTVFCQKLYEGK